MSRLSQKCVPLDISLRRKVAHHEPDCVSCKPINPALIARLAILHGLTYGQDIDRLPRELFWSLYDLCAAGYESARTIYRWLGDSKNQAPPPILPDSNQSCVTFCHGRFWFSSAALADEHRRVEGVLSGFAAALGGVQR